MPEDYASIQDAIGAASDGEDVCVSPGTYVETIDFSGREVHVRGLGGSAVTVLDGGGVGPVVSFDTKEGPGARLSGFTITGGDEADGAGVYIRGDASSPTLRHVQITDNTATIPDDLYYGTNMGGGMYVGGGAPELDDVTIAGNDARAGERRRRGQPRPGQTARGGGMFLTYYGALTARNLAVCHNETDGSVVSEGGGVSGDPDYPYGEADFRWSNFYDNGASGFSLVPSPVGADGNLEVDPRYADISGGDGVDWSLGLGSGSGMIDAGDPDLLDVNGTRSDIGSHGGPSGL